MSKTAKTPSLKQMNCRSNEFHVKVLTRLATGAPQGMGIGGRITRAEQTAFSTLMGWGCIGVDRTRILAPVAYVTDTGRELLELWAQK